MSIRHSELFTLTLVSLIAFPSLSFAQSTLSIMGGMNKAYVNSSGLSSGLTFTPVMTWTAESQISLKAENEAGLRLIAGYQNRQMDDGLDPVIQLSSIEGAILYDYPIFSFLRIGAGPAISYGLGDVKSVTGSSISYDAYGLKRVDWGVSGSAQLNIPIFSGWLLSAEARYRYGIGNQLLSGSGNFSFNDVKFLFGMGYKFGGHR